MVNELDKKKLNSLFKDIREFNFPECESEYGKQVVNEIKEGFQIILDGMKKASQNINQEL